MEVTKVLKRSPENNANETVFETVEVIAEYENNEVNSLTAECRLCDSLTHQRHIEDDYDEDNYVCKTCNEKEHSIALESLNQKRLK